MNRSIYFFGLAILLLAPCVLFSQGKGYVPWPAQESVCRIWSNNGTTCLDTAIIGDTLGAGRTAWQNHTRVYVLSADSVYYFNSASACSLQVSNICLFMRGESGKTYNIPTTAPNYTYRPRVYFQNPNTKIPAAFGFVINGANDTVVVKNIAFCGYDEVNSPTNIDITNNAGFLYLGTASAGSSIYIDSIVCEGYTVAAILTYANTHNVRIQNSFFADGGDLQKSNLGNGRIYDARNVAVDTVDINNNTILTQNDRTIRHYTSLGPIHNFFFNHNTVANCLSYHGFLSLGSIDSLGTFKIMNNLFYDNFFLGPDTDWTRQGEFSDNADIDPNNGLHKMAWILATKNVSGTPNWTISNNYYCISDSGKAVRNYVTPQHPILYHPITNPEPFMSSYIASAPGVASNAFQRVNVQFNMAGTSPTKLAKFYLRPYALGTLVSGAGNNVFCSAAAAKVFADSASDAGAGKLKSTSKPIENFGAYVGSTSLGPKPLPFANEYNAFYRWPYDLPRMRLDSIFDYLDCNFHSSINLSAAASDGKQVGSTMWNYVGFVVDGISKNAPSDVPGKFALLQNYPNPFNPTTTINYNLSKSTQISLKVYDVLGREVATLFNGVQTAGPQTAVWDASHVASGVYFYKLVAGDFSQIRKMVLLK
jgi:hypothetical protein